MSLKEMIGNEFVTKEGSVVDYDTLTKDVELVGLYFSAHWCGPCKNCKDCVHVCKVESLRQCLQRFTKNGENKGKK